MKAIVYTKYGPPDVLQLTEVEKPAPKDNEILVKVYATTVSPGVLWARTGKHPDSRFFTLVVRIMFGLTKPKKTILGYEVSGEVEAVGKDVKLFKEGDQVFGTTTGLGAGAYAEYVCLPEEWKQGVVARKPANMTYEEAAAVPIGGMTALDLLRKANIQRGQKVLIYGASGSVGTFAVQIAKYHFGAEVTGVCSTRNLEMVRSLGADHVIDYTREDFTRNGQQYNLILAANGYHPISDYLRALKPEGTYVVAGGSMLQLFQAASLGRRASKTGDQKTYILSLVQSQKDLFFIKELLESEKIIPVIDGCYPLSKTPEAFWYFEKVHPKGKVVISVA